MTHTDGLFHQILDDVAAEYDDIESEHQIIDIGAARLARSLKRFDVIVTLNLYGDILSDIAGQIAGSVGLSGPRTSATTSPCPPPSTDRGSTSPVGASPTRRGC